MMRISNRHNHIGLKIVVGLFLISLFSCFSGLEPKADANLIKALKLKGKANRVVQLIKDRQRQGQDIQKELQMAKQVKVLADQGKLDEADALLDDIKRSLDENAASGRSDQQAVAQGEIRKSTSDKFGIWISTLEGKNLKLLISDPKRQMSHTRVSPDHEWVLFTRYNQMHRDGYAYERLGYKNTELCILKMDGSEIRTLVGPKPGILNCNGCWLSDSKKVLYLSTDNPGKLPRLYWIDIESKKITQVPTPGALKVVSDPHQVQSKIVFPAPSLTDRPTSLWIMNSDGSQARELTAPPDKMLAKEKGHHHLGDYDPRMSPDGKKVVVMRNYGKDVYHNIVVDIDTGQETDLTKGLVAEGVAHWSSDGKLLIFRHVDPNNLKKTYGLYTIRPDGTNSKRIPLPAGVLHSPQPSFFPKDGSSPDARIIFSTEKVKFL